MGSLGTIIGWGSHARDIAATRKDWKHVTHHSLFDPETRGPVIIGINDPHVRAQVAYDLGITDREWVHPDAYWDRCTLRHGVHVNYRVGMVRTVVGQHTTIAPGVTIAGDVHVGERVFIGIGASIGNLVTIGDDAIIGAGSVVLKDVEPGAKILGVHA